LLMFLSFSFICDENIFLFRLKLALCDIQKCIEFFIFNEQEEKQKIFENRKKMSSWM
jgi:hypothetical protein